MTTKKNNLIPVFIRFPDEEYEVKKIEDGKFRTGRIRLLITGTNKKTGEISTYHGMSLISKAGNTYNVIIDKLIV